MKSALQSCCYGNRYREKDARCRLNVYLTDICKLDKKQHYGISGNKTFPLKGKKE